MARALRIDPGSKVRLERFDANDTRGYEDKAEGVAALERYGRRLGELQGLLYAENKRAVLVVLQGMDTAGKDGAIRSVFSYLAPMGCTVHSFVAPSEEERDHDFLWRIYQRLPRYGNVGVFNRSHYEDVLAVRVRKLAAESVWRPRFEQINRFEALVTELGTRVLKVFLHIDRDEQRERLLARLHDPSKAWKYQPSDLDDRKLWGDYQGAYEEVLSRCSTEAAPWYVIPANKKWYRNALLARLLVETLEEMDPQVPAPSFDPKAVHIPE